MSAGVSDQRMKGQGNQVNNGPKEHVNEHKEFDTWRAQHHQFQNYTAPISTTMASEPYIPPSYMYNDASFPYQAFGVGDGTWSNSEPMTFLSGYGGHQIGHDSFGMDGMFGGAFGQAAAPAASFNYFPGNGDYSTWGNSRKPHYDEYYRTGDPVYPVGVETLKGIDHGMQSLGLSDGNKLENKDNKEVGNSGSQTKKQMTWATIASQPAKPQPQAGTGGVKKKGPGMPPPPMVPGKHNMDIIGTWGESKSGSSSSTVKSTVQPPAAPVRPAGAWTGGMRPVGPPAQGFMQPAPSHPQHRHPVAIVTPHPQPPVMTPPQQQIQQIQPPQQHLAAQQPSSIPSHPVLDELRIKNNYNPVDFDMNAIGARFFVIKSYSEDDIHRSIKYEIWCSTEHGNKRLDQAYRERETVENGVVYLFFSVNGSGHFCGMARMTSHVDYNASSSVWSQDKWKGQFRVRWIYVKDVPNAHLRHIKLENNDYKPVTNSRDTQEVPFEKGRQVLRVMHSFKHTTSIFDDFIHYERRQEEEDSKKELEATQSSHQNSHHKEREGGGGRGGGGGGRGRGGSRNN